MQKVQRNKVAAICCLLISVLAILSTIMKSFALFFFIIIGVLLVIATGFAISAYQQQRDKNNTK